MSMLNQFRIRYPDGGLISELVQIDHGKYIVRALVQINGITLATGLAAAETVEKAEDLARERALALLDWQNIATKPAVKTTTEPELKPVSAPKPQAVISQPLVLEREQPQLNSPQTVLNSISQLPSPSIVNDNGSSLKTELVETEPLVSLGQEPEIIPTDATTREKQTSLFETPEITIPEPELTIPVVAPSVPDSEPTTLTEDTIPVDFSDVIARTNVELKRLGWTNEQGRDYLLQTYGKRSRQLLSDEELLEFLQYLETQP